MNTLAKLVALYQNDSLSDDVRVVKVKATVDKYEDIRVTGPWENPWGELERILIPAHAAREDITIHTLETPAGRMRAGYGPQTKTLLIVEVE